MGRPRASLRLLASLTGLSLCMLWMGVTPWGNSVTNITWQAAEKKDIEMRGPMGLIEITQEYKDETRQQQNPSTASHTRIIYNRMPKCGSLTTVNVLKRLVPRNGFTFLHSTEYNRVHVSKEEETAVVRFLQSKPTPWLYDRHIRMLNFTRDGFTMPAYINIVREPIDRARSHYYYSNPLRTKMTFDECVKKKNTGRCAPPDLQTRYFAFSSGVDRLTLLEDAKRNMAKYYTVIGIQEDMGTTFQLLERRHPEIFSGILHAYNATPLYNVGNASHRPRQLLPETRERLQRTMATDIELYAFAKQLFYAAKEAAGL